MRVIEAVFSAILRGATTTHVANLLEAVPKQPYNIDEIVSDEYGTALTAAAYMAQNETVQLLLKGGADINVVGGVWGTALAAAAYKGNKRTVEILLYRGADINAVGGQYGTALAAAAYFWQNETVELLLDRGAYIDAVGGQYGTALTVAAYQELNDTVELLLERGADINAVGGEYGTALAAAAYQGLEHTVKLLLGRGADVNVVGGEYGTALATAAAREGPIDILELLLNRVADINSIGRAEYGTALAVGAYWGNDHAVRFLLERGADINAVGGKYGTALATAAYRGHAGTVEILLGLGADINRVGGKYGTALIAAAHEGHNKIVKFLLNRGADINAMGGEYGTALAASLIQRHRKDAMFTFKILLEQVADINAVTAGKYGNALGYAIHHGQTELVSRLLEHGADPIHVGGSYQSTFGEYPTSLHAAQSEGSKAGTRLLKLLEDTIKQHMGATNQPTPDLKINKLRYPFTRPPFPIPYHRPCPSFIDPFNSTLLSDSLSSDILASTVFRVGDPITPEQADVPCRLLNVEVLCRALVALIGLQADTARPDRLGGWMRNDIRYFIACDFDFGLAYAAARVAWKNFEFKDKVADSDIISIQRGQWHKQAQLLDEARSEAISIDHISGSAQEVIESPYSIMPRRVWDLRSNRVVEFRMLHSAIQAQEIEATMPTSSQTPSFWAISHSWTSDMLPIATSINQHQWPVPVPQRTNLNQVRHELLHLGGQYVWLDVLCLRQELSPHENIQFRPGHAQDKQDEWKLDVPTIGNIYRAAKRIVRYFNGLGIPFSPDGWDDPRHWLRRAWTLQEIATENITFNGGIPRDKGRCHVVMNIQSRISGKETTLRHAIQPVLQLAAEVDSSRGCGVYELAREMATRHASHPVDKLSGLFYLLRTTKLPCYNETMSSEGFWKQCFHLLPVQRKIEILFDFAYRGADNHWFPTWAQMMMWPKRDPDCLHPRAPAGLYANSLELPGNSPGEICIFIMDVWTVSHAVLYEGDHSNSTEYKVKIGDKLFGFYTPYLSQEPLAIRDQQVGYVTLAVLHCGHEYNWVVCQALDIRVVEGMGIQWLGENCNVLKKLGVLRTDSCSELWGNGGSMVKRNCLFV